MGLPDKIPFEKNAGWGWGGVVGGFGGEFSN